MKFFFSQNTELPTKKEKNGTVKIKKIYFILFCNTVSQESLWPGPAAFDSFGSYGKYRNECFKM